MNRPETLARGSLPGPGLVEVPAAGGDLPALFGETYRESGRPAVGDDKRLQALQAHLREHCNPLIAEAAALLDLILVLSEGARHDSPRELRSQVTGELQAFHRRLEGHAVSLHSMRVASYALCGAVDEAVLVTEWGSDSDWSMNTLLWSFHQDSTGGENFFRYVADLAMRPDTHAELVELLVLLVDLGFQGRHRISHDGAYALETIRLRLHAVVHADRSRAPPPMEGVEPAAATGVSPWRAALKGFTVCVLLALVVGYWTLYARTQSLAAPLASRIELLIAEYPPVSGVSAVSPAVRPD